MYQCVYSCVSFLSINLVCIALLSSFAMSANGGLNNEFGINPQTIYIVTSTRTVSGYDLSVNGKSITLVAIEEYESGDAGIRARASTGEVFNCEAINYSIHCVDSGLSEQGRREVTIALQPIRSFLSDSVAKDSMTFGKWLRCNTDQNESNCVISQNDEGQCSGAGNAWRGLSRLGILVSDRVNANDIDTMPGFGILVSDFADERSGMYLKPNPFDGCREEMYPILWDG